MTWTRTMTDEVARRIADTGGESTEMGQMFLDDGAAVMGMGRDEYAEWFHRQMSTPGREAEWEAHLQAVVMYRLAAAS